MNIESMVIPALNDFASLYIGQKEPVKSFFHYDITDKMVFEKRLIDLEKRQFQRMELADCIEQYMKDFPSSDATKEALNKLRAPNSVVVLGGQQAGLLTGPLYTIHKIISIIKLAEDQEQKLGIPVVPIFWIAGEDHDFLEINHVYVETEQDMKKISYSDPASMKRMASDIYYSKDKMKQWVDVVFKHLGEHSYTKELHSFIHNAVEQCKTITDFFSYIIMSLFHKHGLLIIDSAYRKLRELEKPYFAQMIKHSVSISKLVLKQQAEIKQYGFTNMIDIQPNNANLFVYKNNERILLHFDHAEKLFYSEKRDIQISEDDLLNLLEQQPEIFSNNVVTRPLMQEFLFPTLCFIGGPGEIAYWGELKLVFELMEMNMPPLIPRLNITFLEPAIERDVNDLQLSLKEVLQFGISDDRKKFLDEVMDTELEEKLQQISQFLQGNYEEIFQRLELTNPGILPIAKKNLQYHLYQLEYLRNKVQFVTEQKHEFELNKYNRIERHLRPNGTPQERVWNICYYLNKYGENFIDQIMSLSFQFDGKHKVIRI